MRPDSDLTRVVLSKIQPDTQSREMVQMRDSQPIRGKQKLFWKFIFFLGTFGTSGTFWNLGTFGTSWTFLTSGTFRTCQQCFYQLVGKTAMPAPSVSSQGKENQENCKALSKFCRIVKLCFLAKWVSSLLACLGPGGPNFATNLILALQPFTINHTSQTGPYKSQRAHVSLYLAVQPPIATNKPK